MATITIKHSGFERKRLAGKVAVKFDVYADKQTTSEVTSGAVFTSMGAARKGAARAVAHFARTNRFPNMCERF